MRRAAGPFLASRARGGTGVRREVAGRSDQSVRIARSAGPRISHGLLSCVALAMPALASCMPAAPVGVSAAPPPRVRVASVRRVRRSEDVDLSGTIESPEPPANLAFLVAGRVASVAVHDGDAVRAGAALARLDPADLRIALAAAAAATARARAGAEKAAAPARAEERTQADLAETEAADAYDRARRLARERSLTAADLVRARTAFETARARRDEARRGAVPADRAAARAGLAEATAAQDEARRQLAQTILRAPRDGYVARLAIAAGDLAAPGAPAIVFTQLDPLEARVDVPETQLHLVRPGARATVVVPALPGRSFAGVVRAIGVTADPASRSYAVHIRLANPRLALRVGMVARTTIRGDAARMRVRVPGRAILRDPQGTTYVYVYDAALRRVFERTVALGTVAGGDVDVASGLRGDERVVVAGAQRAIDGGAVDATSAP